MKNEKKMLGRDAKDLGVLQFWGCIISISRELYN